MNLDFQQILKRTGLFLGEMQPIRSWIVATLAAKPVANGPTGLNCVLTICDKMTFAYFRGWIPQNLIKLNQAKSNQIKPDQTKKMAWTASARFKTKMEACNL
jgi:hypothetical protein